MFKCLHRDSHWTTVTVYCVDFNHDAFLVNWNGEFKWVPMDEFVPFNDDMEE